MFNLVSLFGFILLSVGLAVVLTASINEAPLGVLVIMVGLCLIVGKFISPRRDAPRTRPRTARRSKQ